MTLRRRTIGAVVAALVAVTVAVAIFTGVGRPPGVDPQVSPSPAVTGEATGAPTEPAAVDASQFVSRDGDAFVLAGEPFLAAGSNNYRPMFLDPAVVDQVMAAAADNGHTVLRAWAFNDIGDPDDPATSIDPQNTTTYFQYWDTDAGAPAFNEGEKGLEALDRMVASAKEHDVRLVLPFVNNWGPFGGMDQYVSWAGAEYHSDFYTDEQIRQWYKDWVEHLLTRVNTITGVAYRDEPTIMAWELANEARCLAAGDYEAGPDCTTETITAWATEMAAFVKSIDGNHLVGFGDEGFMCEPGADHFAYDCSQGTDSRAIAQIEDIDMVGLHVYPDHWGTTVDWSEQWILDHVALAAEVDKPVFIGELGWRGQAPRNAVFHQWLSAYFEQGGDVALYWLMQPRDEYSTPPDSDGFTAYCPGAVCTQVGMWTRSLNGETDLPPVADTDVLVSSVDLVGSVDLLANDVSLASELDRTSVDLDPATDGVQATLSTPEGELSVADGVLTFTPVAGWSGRSQLTYTVADLAGRVGEPASVTVRVTAIDG